MQSYTEKKKNNELYFIDRRYREKRSDRERFKFHSRETSSRFKSSFSRFETSSSREFSRRKKCFVCQKKECWSINHTQQKRDESKKRFVTRFSEYKSRHEFDQYLQEYITYYEDNNDENDVIYFFENLFVDAFLLDDSMIELTNELFLISIDQFEILESKNTTVALVNNSFKHRLIFIDETLVVVTSTLYIFNSSTDSRNDDRKFKKILIDSRAVIKSTNDIDQLKVLQRIDHSMKLNNSVVESAVIFIFEIESISSIETVLLTIFIETITFYIISVNTSFLLCLANLNKSEAFFKNITNQIVQFNLNRAHLVIRRYEHAFFLWNVFAYSIVIESLSQNSCFLSDVKLRRLHRRFNYSSIRHLHQILKQSHHEMKIQTLNHLIKYCRFCQRYERSSSRFNFVIKNDINFNFNVIVNILYIQRKSVLHLVNERTRF
jgi:hypothetical protein